ncbi:hypothetical protein JTE90_021360 [Oedothorax gibbosus]|uniref:Uncharacterized protein n=1 Tax=Oedothorax gibbosus TaxID=931172 RepID=A0AAV6TUH4_9ARAC|nr:hypothetical protein JTE90_021360 [Oedothorax gibbosus]
MGSLKACIALFCLLFFLIESIETGEGNRTCSNDSLPCDDGECVSRGKWCDGQSNCKDESDEAYCKKKGWWTSDDPNFCEGTHFLCKIGQCIPLVGKCDGFEDCKDKSDEWKCEPETRDDYDDHLLLTTFSPIPTETTSIESTSIRDGLEKDDIETTTQSSHPIFTKVAQLETSHTDVPSSTNLSTSALKLPETVPTSSQVTITNSTSTKSLPPATHQTIPQPQTWKVDQSHVTITGATIHGSQVYRFISSDPKRYYEGYYNQYGQFVTTYSNEGQERYPRPRTEPPRRHRPPPLTISTAAPLSFDRKLKAPSRFYFAKDYTRTYLRENAVYIDLGRAWILSNRSAEGGWGSETPRALIALSLINNSFVNETYENNIMQKHFQVFLGTSLIRGDTKTTSINRLAMFVNALIATCQNPRDFHGTDYTELVRKRLREQLRNSQHRRNEVQSPNPFVCLSLCLADRDLERQEVHHLITRLQSHDSEDEFEQDENAMAILAVACHLQRHKSIYPSDSEYLRPWDSLLRNATWKLLNRMRDDGSFGSVYSTAIAAQALMSVNETRNWNPELTFNFLREHQKDDGSFGDFLATYLVLPALSGRSLLHLRNTQCTPPNSDRGK